MPQSSKRFLTEAIWLTLCLGLTLLSYFPLSRNAFNNTIDIHAGDTYFILEAVPVLLLIFFLITYPVYFIKEFRHSFQRPGSNWILVITGLALVITLTFLVKIFSGFYTGSWTAYPPLSALTPDKNLDSVQDPVTTSIINLFIVIQVLVLTSLLFVCFRWGKK